MARVVYVLKRAGGGGGGGGGIGRAVGTGSGPQPLEASVHPFPAPPHCAYQHHPATPPEHHARAPAAPLVQGLQARHHRRLAADGREVARSIEVQVGRRGHPHVPLPATHEGVMHDSRDLAPLAHAWEEREVGRWARFGGEGAGSVCPLQPTAHPTPPSPPTGAVAQEEAGPLSAGQPLRVARTRVQHALDLQSGQALRRQGPAQRVPQRKVDGGQVDGAGVGVAVGVGGWHGGGRCTGTGRPPRPCARRPRETLAQELPCHRDEDPANLQPSPVGPAQANSRPPHKAARSKLPARTPCARRENKRTSATPPRTPGPDEEVRGSRALEFAQRCARGTPRTRRARPCHRRRRRRPPLAPRLLAQPGGRGGQGRPLRPPWAPRAPPGGRRPPWAGRGEAARQSDAAGPLSRPAGGRMGTGGRDGTAGGPARGPPSGVEL